MTPKSIYGVVWWDIYVIHIPGQDETEWFYCGQKFEPTGDYYLQWHMVFRQELICNTCNFVKKQLICSW